MSHLIKMMRKEKIISPCAVSMQDCVGVCYNSGDLM